MCVLMSMITGIENANSLVWYSVPYRIYSYINIIYEYSIIAMLCVVTLTPATCHAICPYRQCVKCKNVWVILKMLITAKRISNTFEQPLFEYLQY